VRVLGIDPGLRLTGYACIEDDASSAGGVVLGAAGCTIVEAGVFRLTNAGESISARLAELDRDLRDAIKRLRPELVAVEGLFSNYKHPATAIKMGHARGVVLLAIQAAGVELMELKPASVKKAMTGYGQATKAQMQDAVRDIFGLDEAPSPPDVADAIAIAWCARHRANLMSMRGDV